MKVHWRMLSSIIVCVMLVTGLLSPLRADRAATSATVSPDSPTQGESMDGSRRPIVLRLDPSTSTFRIPAPASYIQRSPVEVQAATINVTYLITGTTDAFGLSCLTWPAEAIAAFEYAASIWETLITSTVSIEVNACWTNFGDPDILGISAADNYYRDFSGAPQAGTWYPTALADALHGSRISGSTVDMHVAYGSTFPWYYGTDGSTPTDKVDFATVVLHEICHGLGFAGSMNWDDGVYVPVGGNYQECNGVAGYGCWGAGTAYPDSYDHFTEDGSGNDLINTTSYPNPSTALGNVLTGQNVWFNGTHANAANGGGRVRLYAPSSWQPGSSYSHLDEIFNGTADDLMTYAIPNGQSMHAPGPIIMGILHDVGWPLSEENTAPVLSGLPDLTLSPGEARNNAIDLWTYATDDLDADSVMTYTITNSPPLTVGVTIDINRYIDITPTASFTGTFPIVVEVMDTGGLTDTDTFVITFTEIETQYIYLPLVLRSYPLPPELPTEFDAIEDADISQAYPTTNNGASSSMYVGYDDYHTPGWEILRSMIKFDVSEIPASTSISSAVLRVYYTGYYDYAGYSRTITSYRISSNWSEASVTWNTAPSIAETYGTVSLIAASSSFGWYSIDVTNLVRGWVNGTLPNYGVMLRGPEQSGSDSSWRNFATKEAGSSYTPYLQITYTTMAATEEQPDIVVPLISSVPSNGTQSSKRLVDVSKDPLCDVFGCVVP
jgi:hypothetical protein